MPWIVSRTGGFHVRARSILPLKLGMSERRVTFADIRDFMSPKRRCRNQICALSRCPVQLPAPHLSLRRYINDSDGCGASDLTKHRSESKHDVSDREGMMLVRAAQVKETSVRL